MQHWPLDLSLPVGGIDITEAQSIGFSLEISISRLQKGPSEVMNYCLTQVSGFTCTDVRPPSCNPSSAPCIASSPLCHIRELLSPPLIRPNIVIWRGFPSYGSRLSKLLKLPLTGGGMSWKECYPVSWGTTFFFTFLLFPSL